MRSAAGTVGFRGPDLGAAEWAREPVAGFAGLAVPAQRELRQNCAASGGVCDRSYPNPCFFVRRDDFYHLDHRGSAPCRSRLSLRRRSTVLLDLPFLNAGREIGLHGYFQAQPSGRDRAECDFVVTILAAPVYSRWPHRLPAVAILI